MKAYPACLSIFHFHYFPSFQTESFLSEALFLHFKAILLHPELPRCKFHISDELSLFILAMNCRWYRIFAMPILSLMADNLEAGKSWLPLATMLA